MDGVDRGASLVARHASQQLLEQQLQSIERLLAPPAAAAGPATARAALEASAWVESDARRLLKEFAGYKRMNHQQSRGDGDARGGGPPGRADEEPRGGGRRRRRGGGEEDDSASGGSSSEDSEEEEERRRRRRRKKEKKRQRKEERRRERREKKERRAGGARGYGSRGLVRDADVAIGGAKHAEFVAWCSKVKHLGVENMPAYEERALRREFMEDFNTATLAGGDRYYDLAASEARRGEGEGEGRAAPAAAAAANWEEDRRRERERERTEAREAEIKRLRAVMKGTGVAEAMREQAQLREEMAMMYRVGNMDAAERLKERLAPDEEKFDAETGRYRKRQDKR